MDCNKKKLYTMVNIINDLRQLSGNEIFVAFVVSWGFMVLGLSCGYTSPALGTMQQEDSTVHVTESWASLMVCVLPLAALVGSIVSEILIVYIGRRNTILTMAVPLIVGWLSIAITNNVVMIVTGRAINGFGVGAISRSLFLYLNEIFKPTVRNLTGRLLTISVNIGIFVSYTVGMFMNWSQLAYIGVSCSFFFLVLIMFTPETPFWYILHHKLEFAKRSLQWLRKDGFLEGELSDIENLMVANKRRRMTLFDQNCLYRIFVFFFVILFQQLSGINAIIFYNSQVFRTMHRTNDGNLSAIMIGGVNFVLTFITRCLINQPHKKLFYITAVCMIISLICLGGLFFVRDFLCSEMQQLSWLPTLFGAFYVLGHSLSFGPFPDLIMRSILPDRIIGSVASIAIHFSWLCIFIVAGIFPITLKYLGAYGTFWSMAGISILGIFFIMYFYELGTWWSLDAEEETEKRYRFVPKNKYYF